MPRQSRKCPSTADFVRSFLDETPIEHKFALLDHVAGCPECSREFESLVELQREIPEGLAGLSLTPREMKAAVRKRLGTLKETGKSRAGSSPFSWKFIPYFASAAALVAVSVMLAPLFNRHPAPDLAREAGSGRINFIAPAGDTLRAPFLFRWLPVRDAESYTLDILDDALLPVMTVTRIPDAEHALTPEESYKLVPGRAYFWKVTAELRDLRKLESAIGRFTMQAD